MDTNGYVEIITAIGAMRNLATLVLIVIVFLVNLNVTMKVKDIKDRRMGELMDFTRGILRQIHAKSCEYAATIIKKNPPLECNEACGKTSITVQVAFFTSTAEKIFMSDVKSMCRTSFAQNGFHDLANADYDAWVRTKAEIFRQEVFKRMRDAGSNYPNLAPKIGSRFTEAESYEFCKMIYDQAKFIHDEEVKDIKRAIPIPNKFLFWIR